MSLRDDIVKRALSLPALPSSAVEAIGALQAEEVDFDKVARIVELDPGLTANVLKLANSPVSGSIHAVDQVGQATVRLGVQTILRIVLASALKPVASEEACGYAMGPKELWRHSAAVALCAQIAPEVLGRPDPSSAFTAGLLHDLGKIAMATFMESEGEQVSALARDEGISFHLAEREVLGIDHAEVGALLLEHWRIPEPIVEAVRWHHAPPADLEAGTLVDIVHVCDHLCTIAGIGLGCDGLNYQLDAAVARRLQMTPELADQIVYQTVLEFDRLAEVFDLGRRSGLTSTHGT